MEQQRRTPVSDVMRKRMQERGLSFPLPAGPLTVICEVETMTHTVAFPVCDDPECICYALEREQIIEETTPPKRRRSRRPLVEKTDDCPGGSMGNNGFRLMR